MRKFKHKKTGQIYIKESEDSAYYKVVTDHIQGSIHRNFIEDCSDWEEVVIRDFEILSFQGSIDNRIILKQDSQLKNCFSKIDGRSPFLQLEHLLQDSMYNIYSVKRLSDGEIFTVGDTLVTDEKIVSIGLVEEKIRIYPRNSFYRLENVKKPKRTPLFTIEDGVEIFEGDYYCRVGRPGQHNEFKCWDGGRNTIATNQYRYDIVNKQDYHFSSIEEAELFILWNKPLLNLKDLFPNGSVTTNFYWRILAVAKSKLNG